MAASSYDVLGALTELLQVLPAEWSAEVPKKGYDYRPRLPEIGNRDLFAATAAEGNVRCQLAGLNRHILGSSSSLTSIARHDADIVGLEHPCYTHLHVWTLHADVPGG